MKIMDFFLGENGNSDDIDIPDTMLIWMNIGTTL